MSERSGLLTASHPAEPAAKVARFGLFELDLRAAELRREGVKVKLQDQPFRLLALLVENAGQTVTRDQLRQSLWPSEFVDFDHSLNAAVGKLRSALEDSADSPRFIETVAKRGYRFVAPVSWNATSPAAPRAPSSQSHAMVIAVAVLLLVTAAGALLLRTRTVSQPLIDSIAILPFTTDEHGGDAVSDGLTEILIDTMSRVPGLRVMARSTVFRYKNRLLDTQQIGRTLDVGGVVVGRIHREQGQSTLHVELIAVRDGTQLWGNQFDLAGTNFAIADRIAAALSDRLRRDRAPAQTATPRYTKDAEAYELYLKGLYAWNKRGADDLRLSVDYFERAVRRDPNFAAAYAGLAQAYGVECFYGLISVAEGIAKVTRSAEKALQLDPNNVEALVCMATIKHRNVWDFAGADADYRRALALNPNYATGHQWYADYLRDMGRFPEARREIEVAYKLDPLSQPINADMCYGYYVERRYRDAIAFSQRAAQLDSRFVAPGCVAGSLLALGETDAAFAVMQRAGKGPLRGCEAILAEVYRTSGRRGFLEKSTEHLINQQIAGNFEAPVLVAGMYGQMGNRAAAFLWLERAYKNRVGRLTDLAVDPMFDPLRSDPRYDDLLARIGLPHVTPPAAQR